MAMTVMRMCVSGLFLGVVSMLATPAQAAMISVTSSADLSQLHIGTPVLVAVELTGLAGEELALLDVTVDVDGNTLGSQNVTPGPIVLDLLGFASIESFGSVTGTYFADPVTPQLINNDGVFLSFELVPLAMGKSEISIALAFADDLFGNGVSLDIGPALNATVVPEPASWVSFGACVLMFVMSAARRRHQRRINALGRTATA